MTPDLTALVAKWRVLSRDHYEQSEEFDRRWDGANAHAERKAGRIYRECANDLEATFAVLPREATEMTAAANAFAAGEISSGKLAEVLGCDDKHGFRNHAHAWCDATPAAPREVPTTTLDLTALVREADLDAQLMANALYNIPHRVQADGSVRWEGRDSDHLRDLRLRWETSSRAMREALAALPRKAPPDPVALSEDATGAGAVQYVRDMAKTIRAMTHQGALLAYQPPAPPVEDHTTVDAYSCSRCGRIVYVRWLYRSDPLIPPPRVICENCEAD